MKKSLIIASSIGLAGLAHAQSSTTLFGIMDATVAYGSGSIGNRIRLANSGNSSSRLGIRAVEDLGSGMSASFWLEAGINNDEGTGQASNTNNQASGAAPAGAAAGGLTFNRRSTVSLAGKWGELRLGRDYTPQFWNLARFDPFGFVGVGATQTASTAAVTGPTAVRASNSLGLLTSANLGGFYGQFAHYRGENPSNAPNPKDGTGDGLRVGYANAAIDVALALSRTRYAAGDVSQHNLGASYDFGFARVMGQYTRDRNEGAAGGTAQGRGILLGTVVPVGAGEFKASFSSYRTAVGATEPTTRKYAIGYVYNLSKRTAAYATLARLSNSGGASAALNAAATGANQSSRGYDVGLRHAF